VFVIALGLCTDTERVHSSGNVCFQLSLEFSAGLYQLDVTATLLRYADMEIYNFPAKLLFVAMFVCL
jgi:hypothetical protein